MTLLVSDTFTDTNGTTLPNHTPDTGTGWERHLFYTYDFLINSLNQGVGQTTVNCGDLTIDVPTSSTYDVSIDIIINVTTANNDYGFLLRSTNSAIRNYYLLRTNIGSNQILLYRYVNNSLGPTVKTWSYTFSAVTTINFAVSTYIDGNGDPVFELYIDSVLQDTAVADTHVDAITSIGRVGLWSKGSLNAFDNFILNQTETDSITLTDIEQYKVHQRNGSGNGTVQVAGTYLGSPTAIEARVMSGITEIVTWTVVDAAPSGGVFSGTITAPTGGFYTLEVRFSNMTNINASGTNTFSVGDNYIIAGQSNADQWFIGGGVTPASTLISIHKNGNWSQASSSSNYGAVAFANNIFNNEGNSIPIGVIHAALGGTALLEANDSGSGHWLTTAGARGPVYTNYFTQALSEIGSSIASVVWVQGETDAGHGVVEIDYKNGLDPLFGFFRTDTGNATLPICISHTGRSTGGLANDAGFQAVRNAQETVIGADANIGGTNMIDLTLIDDIHYADHSICGSRCGQVVSQLKGYATYSEGARITGFTVVDSTHLDFNIIHDGGTDITPATGITGFRVFNDGSPITLSSVVRQSANSIRATLASAPTGAITADYLYGVNPDISGGVFDNSVMTLPLHWNVSITNSIGIIIQNITQTESLVNVGLTQQNILSTEAITNSEALSQVNLIQQNLLELLNITQTENFENIFLIQQNLLEIQNLINSELFQNTDLIQQNILTTNDIVQTEILDNIDLTQQNILVLSNIAQSEFLENNTLSLASNLIVQSLSNSETLEIPALVQQNILIIQSLSNSEILEIPSIIQQNILSPQDITNQENLENIALQSGLFLTIQNILNSEILETLDLTQQNTLVATNIQNNETLFAVNLIQQNILNIDNILNTEFTENIALTLVNVLTLEDISNAESLVNIALLQELALAVSSLTQIEMFTNVTLTQQGILVVDDILHSQLLASFNLISSENLSKFDNVIYIINSRIPIFITSSNF